MEIDYSERAWLFHQQNELLVVPYGLYTIVHTTAVLSALNTNAGIQLWVYLYIMHAQELTCAAYSGKVLASVGWCQHPRFCAFKKIIFHACAVDAHQGCQVSHLFTRRISSYIQKQEHIRTATRVRACDYVKIETRLNFPPVLKIVTRTAQAA